MNLGDRMKAFEDSWKVKFPPRMPIIVRIDGRAFHTYTKGLIKPYHPELHLSMIYAMRLLMLDIGSTIVLGYTQSDEASIFIHTYNKFDTESWFGGEKFKIETVCSSIFTSQFNHQFKLDKLASFDARAFVLPKEEVYNYFLWRQRDCVRNAVLSYAKHKFGHTRIQNKNVTQLIDMIGPEWGQVNQKFVYGTFLHCTGDMSSPLEKFKEEIESSVYFQEES